ncbi:MAG: hypothetical protein PVJ38_01400 [Candidatus Bathyarchaeota archaeon]
MSEQKRPRMNTEWTSEVLSKHTLMSSHCYLDSPSLRTYNRRGYVLLETFT